MNPLQKLKASLDSLSFPEDTLARVLRFHEMLVDENSRQNLTRLVSFDDFYEGHWLDCVELLRCGFLTYPAVDLGSGGGVPGLLTAILDGQSWILVESEIRKAEFLQRAVTELGLSKVTVEHVRIEEMGPRLKAISIVARAVGKVEKIYGWLEKCSTWNKLILLKGPGWDEEWKEFQLTRHRGKLSVKKLHEYEVGSPEKKSRKIVLLEKKSCTASNK